MRTFLSPYFSKYWTKQIRKDIAIQYVGGLSYINVAILRDTVYHTGTVNSHAAGFIEENIKKY